MIWLTWRQFRTQALVAVIALAALAGYLVYLGFRIRHDYTADVVNCVPTDCNTTRRLFMNRYGGQVGLIGAVLIAVPGLIGAFWGAPLVARELETKTDRLVWNQSITRARWLAVKLAIIGTATLVVTGLFSLLLTWSASRYDQYAGDRFAAMNFAARNVVPLGYAAFAFVLGTVVGLLVRRTVPSMAIVVAIVAAVQIVVPLAIRANLMSPLTSTVPFTADAMQHADGFGISNSAARIMQYTLPGTWSMQPVSQIYNADGTPFTAAQARSCMAGDPDKDFACLAAQNLHFSYTYQPGSRYWPFQWIELSGLTVLTVLLAGFGFWWVRRRLS